MTNETAAPRLSRRQSEMLERVCLRRYTVVFEHYMGSHRPNESVYVDEAVGGQEETQRDWSFRPTTVEALRQRKLVHLVSIGQGHSHVKPTAAGLDAYRAARGTA